MSDSIATWVIAGFEIVAALGIVAYWFTWFREPHDEPWLPDGYVDHEVPFVYTDTILAIVLVAAAALQVTEAQPGAIAVLVSDSRPVGDSLGLIAAGMLAFLGILDLVYFARTGLFKREHGGVINVGVVTGVLLLSIILFLRFV